MHVLCLFEQVITCTSPELCYVKDNVWEKAVIVVAMMTTTQAMSRKLKDGEARKELVQASFTFWKDSGLEPPRKFMDLAARLG